MQKALKCAILAVVLVPVICGLSLADYIPEAPDTLDILRDPAKTPVLLHFYTPGNGMPVNPENLDAEEIFISGFVPDSLIDPIIGYMIESIEEAAPHAKPPLGIAAVVASWNDADYLTVGVIVGGDPPHTILWNYEYPLPLPMPGDPEDPDAIPVERSIFAVAFNPESPEKDTTGGTWATGVASGPGGESYSDGIDIHHPDKAPMCEMPDSLTVCMGGELGTVCVRLRSDATLTPETAIEILLELFGEVEEVGQAMSAAMDNNQQEILDSGYEQMLSFFVEGESGCEEGDNSAACMVFEGGEGIGLPLGGWLRLSPRVMNLASHGRWIRAKVMPQAPYSAEDIDLASVVLSTELGEVHFDPSDPWRLIHLCNGKSILRMHFPWCEFSQILEKGRHVEVTCEFKIGNQLFVTTDYVRVIDRWWWGWHKDDFDGKHEAAEVASSSGTHILFAINRAGAQSRLDVFDVRGRLINTLVDEQLPPGEYSYSWSGEDSRGVRMPAGVYFYRLQVDDFESSSKFILLR
jgi:hypothetical protein